MSDKPAYKMTANELREGSFRPRLWSNGGHPIEKTALKEAIKKAEENDKKVDEGDFFGEFEDDK